MKKPVAKAKYTLRIRKPHGEDSYPYSAASDADAAECAQRLADQNVPGTIVEVYTGNTTMGQPIATRRRDKK